MLGRVKALDLYRVMVLENVNEMWTEDLRAMNTANRVRQLFLREDCVNGLYIHNELITAAGK